jgi:hypothetical protein
MSGAIVSPATMFPNHHPLQTVAAFSRESADESVRVAVPREADIAADPATAPMSQSVSRRDRSRLSKPSQSRTVAANTSAKLLIAAIAISAGRGWSEPTASPASNLPRKIAGQRLRPQRISAASEMPKAGQTGEPAPLTWAHCKPSAAANQYATKRPAALLSLFSSWLPFAV